MYENIAQWEYQSRPGCPTLRGSRWVLFGPTRKQLVDIHGAGFKQELEFADGDTAWWRELNGKINKTSWRIEFPGGSWIQLFGAENAENARGIRADGVCVDETDDVEPSDYDGVVSPWLSEPWSFKKRLLGGTPRRGRLGLLYRQHRIGVTKISLDGTKPAPDYHSFHATYKDAPEQVDVKYVETQVIPNTPPAIVAREWRCDFDANEGLVYPFDENFHVRKPHPDTKFNEILVGVDHGYEDPGVFLLAAVQGGGRDATVWVLYELYETQRTGTWWNNQATRWKAEIRKEFGRDAQWYADPSRPDRIGDLLTVSGVKIIGAENDIEPGVSAVADRVFVRHQSEEIEPGVSSDKVKTFAKLYVHPRCKNTIREFQSYRRKRDPRDRERFTDEIEDRNNHAMDALRYIIMTRFGAPQAYRSIPGHVYG